MLLPDSMELRICVPYNSRSTAWASFDGRGRVELKQGDHIKVTASKYPFPTVCADKQSTDWFHAIARTLKWNERERQKSFVVVEEGPAKHKQHKKAPSTQVQAPQSIEEDAVGEEDEELEGADEEDEEEDEEDKFDIDDSSAEASAASSSKASSGQPSPAHHATTIASEKVTTAQSSYQSSTDSATDTPASHGRSRDKPQPSNTHPRHLISDAAEKIRHLQDPHPSDPSPPKSQRGENGDRDNIRAPESTFHSSKSRIPLDRDVEAESMRTPRPDVISELHKDATGNHVHIGSRSISSSGGSHSASAHHSQFSSPAQPPPAGGIHPLARRNHRRHRSVDTIGAPRRAFAAWGLDESDSNASDSDA